MCRYHFDVWSGSDSMKKNQIDSFSVFSTRGKSASNVLFLSQNNINTEKKIIIWCNVGKMFLNSKICHKINMLQNSHDTRRQADIAIDSGSDSVLYKILLASSDATLHNTIQVFF